MGLLKEFILFKAWDCGCDYIFKHPGGAFARLNGHGLGVEFLIVDLTLVMGVQ